MGSSSGDAEPPSKRVRFNGDNAEDAITPSGKSAGASPAASSVQLDAAEAIELRFVRTSGDMHRDGVRGPHKRSLSSRPTFLHQIFPESAIVGYTSANVAMYFTCTSLHCWIDTHLTPERSMDGRSEPDEARTDVPNTLAKFVRSGLVQSRHEFESALEDEDGFEIPFSEPVATYSRRPKRSDPDQPASSFSVYKAMLSSADAVIDYHRRMQLLMLLHIDNANFIDDADPRWELFVVFERIGERPRRFVGYATVYPFSAMRPGRTLDDGFGERIRVSQVVVLPHYQRAGHGAEILRAIYADAKRRNAIEVTVEDPSEGFRKLRDAVDLRRAYEHGILSEDKDIERADDTSLVAKLHKELYITKAQARRALEVHRLRFVDKSDKDSYRDYRLWVKRRLYSEYEEVLDAFRGAERKAKLAEIYDDFEKEYLHTVSRLRPKPER